MNVVNVCACGEMNVFSTHEARKYRDEVGMIVYQWECPLCGLPYICSYEQEYLITIRKRRKANEQR